MDFSRAADLFDLYVDWDRRLSREIPFLVEKLSAAGACRVADVACGTGRHAAALAREGFKMTGFDPDPLLLDRARKGSWSAGEELEWVEASFSTLPRRRPEPDRLFDGVLCLGNSLSLIPPDNVPEAFENMAGLVGPGGVLVVHTLNYPALAARKEEPWGPVRKAPEDVPLLKGFVPHDGGRPWDAIFIRLGRKSGSWKRKVYRFLLHPHGRDALEAAARDSGLVFDELFGGFAGENPGDPRSADLLYLFRR